MVIGLGPQYNYPGNLDIWRSNNTRYASNLGASLISNALLKEFNADYIDNFSDIQALKNKYDTCLIAFATHITTWRDVSLYADVIEKLDMKTIALSLGVQDYAGKSTDVFKLHPSIKRLLEIVSSSSEWIGVRGHYTASILYQNGFSNVVPIGCPTMYWGLKNDLHIQKAEKTKKPLLVFHRALADNAYRIMQEVPVLGQDYEDHVAFTNDLDEDTKLKKWIDSDYDKLTNKENVRESIQKNGIFVKDFKQWFNIIGQHDFIFGSRLHGCIAGLIQKKPSVLIPRDLRVREISDFFDIPTVSIDQLKNMTVQDIYANADYSKFNTTYKIRYNNYYKFIEENGLKSQLEKIDAKDFIYNQKDIKTNINIYNLQYAAVQEQIENLKKEIYGSSPYITARNLNKLLKKIPFAKRLAKKLT